MKFKVLMTSVPACLDAQLKLCLHQMSNIVKHGVHVCSSVMVQYSHPYTTLLLHATQPPIHDFYLNSLKYKYAPQCGDKDDGVAVLNY